MYVILKVSTHLSSFIIHLFLFILYVQGHTGFLSVSQICHAVSLTSGLLFTPFLRLEHFSKTSTSYLLIWSQYDHVSSRKSSLIALDWVICPSCVVCCGLLWNSQKMLALHYILVISLAGLRSRGQEPSMHCPLLYSRDLEQQLAQSRS